MPADVSRTILQISTRDIGGGAERVASDLFKTYRARGHRSVLGVGFKHSRDPDILPIRQSRGASMPARPLWWLHERLQPWYSKRRLVRGVCRLCHRFASPAGYRDIRLGRDNFDFPGSRLIEQLPPVRPDVIHLHNLHGGYFDLETLPQLSQTHHVVLTLHDAWLLGGHCAHSFDCERWRDGCGACPYPGTYPAVRRDATAQNWERRKSIFARCRLHVATPCQWLMDKVRSSMLAPGIVSSRVIPYGIDLDVFHPGDRQRARRELGWGDREFVLLFAANGIRRNDFKDYETMRRALSMIARHKQFDRPVIFLALGEEGRSERIGSCFVKFAPFEADVRHVARYYRAADLYLHAARADTFPNAILEALACGTPVVATNVGGIGEQVYDPSGPSAVSGAAALRDATGCVVPAGDAECMANAVCRLLIDDDRRRLLALNAAAEARRRFDLRRHASDYLSWYEEILTPDTGRSASMPRSEVVPPGVFRQDPDEGALIVAASRFPGR